MTILAEKRLLITGVVSTESIAYSVAAAAQGFGAEVLLTGFERDHERTVDAAATLPDAVEVLELDVTDASHYARLEDELRSRWGHVDGVLHAVAFAPRPALGGDFLAADRESVERAFATSTFSYGQMAGLLASLAPDDGGAIVGLDFDAAGAWPVYNWMGVCKAALESVSRYVARDLGPRRIRSNLVAAGPLHTRAANGIPEFDRLTRAWEARAPMTWNPVDNRPVADATCFLLSDLARAVTGEILHVDGGYHAMAADLR